MQVFLLFVWDEEKLNKWPKEAIFILFKETINLWEIDKTKETRFGCLISEESENLSLG